MLPIDSIQETLNRGEFYILSPSEQADFSLSIAKELQPVLRELREASIRVNFKAMTVHVD